MLFNSIDFLLFFIVVFVLFHATPRKHSWVILLLSSYFFYAYLNIYYSLLLLSFTVVHYGCTVAMEKTRSTGKRRVLLATGVLYSLSVLFFYKYFGSAIGHFVPIAFLGLIGPGAEQNLPGHVSAIVLPAGLSFYTFQTLSYTIDVYNGKISPERNFGKFALFVSFFPQLIIGPVERAGKLLPQLIVRREFDTSRFHEGVRLFFWGLFKKMAIADRIAIFLDPVYNTPTEYETGMFWVAFFMFPIQLYADFSGYADMARGLGKMLGIELSPNFRLPLFASSVRDFWTRWNYTVSNWFRDYVFYPLYTLLKRRKRKNNRLSHDVSFVLALSINFILLGLWHGAHWKFVLLGIGQAIFILFEIYLLPSFRIKQLPDGAVKILNIGRTFFLFSLMALLLRGRDLDHIFMMLKQMTKLSGFTSSVPVFEVSVNYLFLTLINLVIMFFLEFVHDKSDLNDTLERMSTPLRWSAYLIFLAIIGFTGVFHKSTEFYYMQF